MTELDLDRIKALHKKIPNKGPWGVGKGTATVYAGIIEDRPGLTRYKGEVCACMNMDEEDAGPKSRAVARFIAAAYNHMPALIAEVERLRQDNEAADGTDAAHPSYWRGSDATFAAMCEQLRQILDGEDDCAGKCQEPWDTLRRRVLALRSDCFALATPPSPSPKTNLSSTAVQLGAGWWMP